MKNRRKKKKILSLIVIALLVLGILGIIFLIWTKLFVKKTEMFVASVTNKVAIYNESFQVADDVCRGIAVTMLKKVNNEKDKYFLINYKKRKFYIKQENLVNKVHDVVLEKEMYVRTPTSIVKGLDDITILGLASKEAKLTVVDYDKINEEGLVNKYKVKTEEGIVGYVYGKYLVRTSELASKNYDEEKLGEVLKKVTNPYGGGEAIKLDYYPNEKPSFANNVMPEAVYALYINNWHNTIQNIDNYIAFAKETKINTLVIDIKENGSVGYPSTVMKEMSTTSYSRANNTYDEYKEAINKVKEAGLYVVGRIVVFKDDLYLKDNPNEAIANTSNNEPYYHQSAYWPTGYSRNVWSYNVKLALEAVKEFGFNEINYDYVRFPDGITKVTANNTITLKNTYNEDKAQAIQRFLQYATDALHEVNTYLSVDVFGESNSTFVTSYGQYWPAISNVVDVISGMPYPDHFASGNYGLTEPWNHPYELMNAWAKQVVKRQNETPSPAKVRTWVQSYNAQKQGGIEYNAPELKAEITGLYDAGVKDGYITWHSSSNLDKYKKQQAAFEIDYVLGGY